MVGYNSRLAGVCVGRVALGYSLQNTTQMFTRFSYMALLPMLGYLTDLKISPEVFQVMVHIALFMSFVMSVFVYCKQDSFFRFYYRLIKAYDPEKGLMDSVRCSILKDYPLEGVEFTKEIKLKIFAMSSLIYTIYSVGVFAAFLMAINMTENRGVLSQLSGVLNGFATLLLALKVDPYLSSFASSENFSEFKANYRSLILGRIFGVGIVSQIFIWFWCLWLN